MSSVVSEPGGVPHIAVVGGGITGLVAARELSLAGARVTVIERSGRAGGKIATDQMGGTLIEHGPDSFVTYKRSVLELVEDLGMSGEIIPSRKETSGTHIWWDGRLHPLPAGLQLVAPGRLGPTMRSTLFSPSGKARILCDLVIPRRRQDGDESLGSFVTRRMGRQMLERVSEPMVAGIHAATPETMSLRAGFPRLPEMEAKHRSLILAARRAAVGNAASTLSYFATFVGGMGSLVDGLVQSLAEADIRLGVGVKRIEHRGTPFELHLSDSERIEVDGVVLAVPADSCAALLRDIAPAAAREVAAISQISTTVVNLVFREEDLPSLAGHGFLVPEAQKRQILGVSYMTRKWGRSGEPGTALLRVFLGGSRGHDLTRAGSEDQIAAVRSELRELAGITAAPVRTITRTWDDGLHQYTMGHLDRVGRAESALDAHPGVVLAGAAFHGIGLNECVDSGRRAARKVLAGLTSSRVFHLPGRD